MDLPASARVDASDGTVGRLTSLVLDPKKGAVTHLVVAEADALHTLRLVPIDLVLETTPRTVKLRCTRREATDLPGFIEAEYIQAKLSRYEGSPAFRFFKPVEIPLDTGILVEHRHIPTGELTIDEGACVRATDGRLGRIAEAVVEPADGHLTHVILRWGHFWNRRDVRIPVDQIARFDEDTICLRLNKRQVGALPVVTHEARSV